MGVNMVKPFKRRRTTKRLQCARCQDSFVGTYYEFISSGKPWCNVCGKQFAKFYEVVHARH